MGPETRHYIFETHRMKHIFCSFFSIFFFFQGFAQLIPVRNPDALILGNKVKSCNSYFKDERSGANHLMQKLEYDEDGRLVSEYLLYLWDVVSYSYTSGYTYNKDGQIAEILKIQEILNLSLRDEDYIESFGDMPVNEKIVFSYDEAGLLVKKEIFVFHSDNIEDDAEARQTIMYQYESGKLVVEESSSPESRIFNKTYLIDFAYDSAGNLIREIRSFGREASTSRETRYVYDTTGFLVEKIVIDKGAPHNNKHEKYEYDSLGNLTDLYVFSSAENTFELEISYKYDSHGQKISGDRDVKFEYLDNGLIKSESWHDDKTDQHITFATEYEYF